MNMIYKCIGKNLIVKFMGELDHHETKNLREEIDEIINTYGVKNIIFDFSNIDFMDSSGIGLIMGRYNKIDDLGGKVYLVNVKPTLDEILKISGIYNIVNKYGSLSELLERI